MSTHPLIDQLRRQPFYRGQILSITDIPGSRAASHAKSAVMTALPHLAEGSLPQLLTVMGQEEVYAGLLAGLRLAYASKGNGASKGHGHDDAVLIASPSSNRERFWQLIALLDALDRSTVSLVVCSNPDRATKALNALAQTIKRADIEYALQVAGMINPSDWAVYNDCFPLIVVLSPESLAQLLFDPDFESLRSRIFNAVGRIVLPSADAWPPALASNSAYLFRKLNLELWSRGSFPSIAATLSPAVQDEHFIRRLTGRPLHSDRFIRDDSVECVPMSLVYYSGAMVREPDNPSRWIRQTLPEVVVGERVAANARESAGGLIEYLVGGRGGWQVPEAEIHYVLDISGSMEDHLPRVKEAIRKDFSDKIAAGSIRVGSSPDTQGDTIRLTVFDEDATEVFHQRIDTSTSEGLDDALKSIGAQGGTNLPLAMSKALTASASTSASAIEMIVFSDGFTDIESSVRQNLLNLSREARARGVSLGMVYVLLEFDPPADVRNLFAELGGIIIAAPTGDLQSIDLSKSSVLADGREGSHVLYLAGEYALPASSLQPFLGGKRHLVYTRDTNKLDLSPRSVAAVVVSGRFPSQDDIVQQIGHLGNGRLPVFILTEAETWSRAQETDFFKRSELRPALLVEPENPHVKDRMVSACMNQVSMELPQFWYLFEGEDAYDTAYERLAGDPETNHTSLDRELPEGYLKLSAHLVGHRQTGEGVNSQANRAMLHAFSNNSIALRGNGINAAAETAWAPVVCHVGAVVDRGERSGVVSGFTADGSINLTAPNLDRTVPILSAVSIEPGAMADKNRSGVGRLAWGPVRATLNVLGIRRYHRGNLDDAFKDEYYADPQQVEVATQGLKLSPDGVKSEPVLIGLTNLIRVGLPGLFRYIDRTLLVIPDAASNAIWALDLVAGGNGASRLLFDHPVLLEQLISLAGRIALDCPCEGGFAGATFEVKTNPEDNGCPRCARVIGPVLFPAPGTTDDIMRHVSKRETLQWLCQHKLLPDSAARHLEEKFVGIEDRVRIVGPSMGTRRAILPLVQKIFVDRLGLVLDDQLVASFEWKKPNGASMGTYNSGDNKIDMVQYQREWFSMDIMAHEYFHNIQYKLPGLFNHDKLGLKGSLNPPYEGKLFIEGSAMWAESQAVDSLAIQSSLTSANLREGDEYGEGFQLMKWIEENCGGVPAVLDFLASGDIAKVSGGKVRDLSHLYSACGIIDKLKERNLI